MRCHRQAQVRDMVVRGALAGAVDQVAQEVDEREQRDMARFLFDLLVQVGSKEKLSMKRYRHGVLISLNYSGGGVPRGGRRS